MVIGLVRDAEDNHNDEEQPREKNEERRNRQGAPACLLTRHVEMTRKVYTAMN